MIIKDIKLENNKQFIYLRANCKIRKIGFDEVYFRVDKKYKDFICEDASAFAASLLIPSMKQGEDLVIKGSISKKLYTGMNAAMASFLSWNLGLKSINIKVDKLTEDIDWPEKVATFFSGGVDSFYTYLKHKKDIKNIISYFILVNGFDIDLRNKNLWATTSNNVGQIAKEEKINLITIESNIRPLIDPIFDWNLTHGGCLAGCGLFLRKGISKIYVPATSTEDKQVPNGTNLATDKLWSSEKLEFIHDGAEATRLNKVIWEIAKSDVALKYLRICYKNKAGTYNCGQCEKCIRTMISLEIAGALSRCETFLDKDISPDKISRIKIKDEQSVIFHQQNLSALKKQNRYLKLQQVIEQGIKGFDNKYTISNINHQLFDRINYLDHIYAKGSLRNFFKLILRRR